MTGLASGSKGVLQGRGGRRPVTTGLVAVLVCLLATALCLDSARAVLPDEVLKDPALEARARTLSAELRCLVCQNQSIDESDAPLARDLRIIVRERLVAGDTDTAVLDYLVARYGEFVLLKPRFGGHTLILWSIGPALLLIGLIAIFFIRKSRAGTAISDGDLTDEEKAAVDRLLRD